MFVCLYKRGYDWTFNKDQEKGKEKEKRIMTTIITVFFFK